MAAILKLIPTIISIIKRTRNLAGAMSSTTTQVQWAATLIVCAIVATIGAFNPALAQDEIAQGAAVFLIGIVGPMLSRIIGKKYKNEPLPNDALLVVGVRKKDDSLNAWRAFDGSLKKAREQGWYECTDGDFCYDCNTGALISNMPTRTPTDNPLQRVMQSGLGTRQKGDGSKYKEQDYNND